MYHIATVRVNSHGRFSNARIGVLTRPHRRFFRRSYWRFDTPTPTFFRRSQMPIGSDRLAAVEQTLLKRRVHATTNALCELTLTAGQRFFSGSYRRASTAHADTDG